MDAPKTTAGIGFATPTPFPYAPYGLNGRNFNKEPAKWAIESPLSAPLGMWAAKC